MPQFACPTCGHRKSLDTLQTEKLPLCSKCQQTGIISNMEQIIYAAPPAQSSIVLCEKGGTVQTKLTDNVLLNKDSSLQREFITVIDNTLPARLTSCVGITTAYEPTTDRSQTGYFYQTSYAVCAIEPIVAFQVRFLLFNVWNAYVRALTSTQISDISIEKIHRHNDRWHLEHKNEAVEHFATVTFIAAVRTVDGQVYHTDTRPIVNAVRNFSRKFDEAIVNQVTF